MSLEVKKAINQFWSNKFSWLLASLIFLFATFPGKGGFEGGQREIKALSDRSDNWGFITPFYFGNFPELNGYWRFALVTIQLFALWIGLYLLIKNLKLTFQLKIITICLIVVCTVFGSQLWRDSTLFCFVICGLGLISFSNNSNNMFFKFINLMGIALVIFGLLFKPIFAFAYSIFIFMSRSNFSFKSKRNILLVIVTGFFLAITLLIINSKLVQVASLQRTFPEQQPMIYDLASTYCWGNTDKIKDESKLALSLVLNKDSSLEDVCAFQILTSWDSLHTQRAGWEKSPPIVRVVDDSEKFNELRKSWFKVISLNFRDYIMAKKPFAAEVITMANSFVKSDSYNVFNISAFSFLNEILWKIFYYFAVFFDKLRLLTLGFLIFLLIFIIFDKSLRSPRATYREFMNNEMSLIILLGNSFLMLLLATFAYVANNGRYVLPFVLTTIIFLIREEAQKSTTI